MMDLDPQMAAALQTFFEESRDLLQEMESALLFMEDHGADLERINAVFRAAHTIKGSAGLFGLEEVVRFTHRLENLLDQIRSGTKTLTPANITLLLSCGDHIGDYLDRLVSGAPLDQHFLSEDLRLLAELQAALGTKEQSQNLPISKAHHLQLFEHTEVSSPSVTEIPADEKVSTSANWHISLRFGIDTFRDGMDPLSFLRYLQQLGDITGLVTLTDALPVLPEMDAESCYLGFEIGFRSVADKATILDVFDFVKESSVVHLLPAHSQIGAYLKMIQQLPEADQHLGEILVAVGSLTSEELQRALALQENTDQTGQHQPLGEILVDQKMVQEPVVQGALEKQQQQRESQSAERQLLRVRASDLDYLVDLVGELVIASAANRLFAGQDALEARLESATQVARLVEEIRDGALRLRMIDVSELFQRFPRVVRDTARTLGKDIRLEMHGEDTELDKSMAEKITDPLMHLVRNAMDHGIEAAEQRLQVGKPAQGCIALHARHDSGGIVIEVSDDGAGLNREKIQRKALEKGLITADQVLSDQEIYALIFAPGFSTADTISDISGRGVGMDVVRQNIESVRGRIEIHSVPGRGSTMRIHLPLTLSIIDGFLVRLAQDTYVIPSESVEECLEYPKVQGAVGYMELRDQPLPLLDLNAVFNKRATDEGRRNVVVVRHGLERIGMVVSGILGSQQTVIKPLGKLFEQVPGIASATILGNGDVAPILDIPTLIQRHYATSAKSAHTYIH
ncbi:chemotaxis protein CheA [Acidithiobacillus thiooxidans]|uniref:chemotaxis protein CheA n=1 Tax=Acidithiobacillus thiooxidans TaxID=930 RepID=UPI001C38206A|nr:chemotaxis protein CheA [Acidithiobacillus thiooxidans]